jgi:hypothetical protein
MSWFIIDVSPPDNKLSKKLPNILTCFTTANASRSGWDTYHQQHSCSSFIPNKGALLNRLAYTHSD